MFLIQFQISIKWPLFGFSELTNLLRQLDYHLFDGHKIGLGESCEASLSPDFSNSSPQACPRHPLNYFQIPASLFPFSSQLFEVYDSISWSAHVMAEDIY